MGTVKERSIFRCPVCEKGLTRGTAQYYCEKGHTYDIARKGYVNLLLSKHTGQGNPGDTKEMLQCRRAFLNRGYYEAFADRVVQAVRGDLEVSGTADYTVLDAGCGEGYYLARVSEDLGDRSVRCFGFDVSKAAIELAAGRDKRLRLAVGSTFHAPVRDASVDALLCLFAPKEEAEFRRILKPKGILVVAAPGPEHLNGLRAMIYGEDSDIGLKGTAGKGFRLLEEDAVDYRIRLESTEDILNLLTMTPYIRHVGAEELERLKGLTALETEVSFRVRVYQRA